MNNEYDNIEKFKLLRELPKCGTETWSEQMLLENGTDRAAQWRAATDLQFVKNAVSAEHSKRDVPVSHQETAKNFLLKNIIRRKSSKGDKELTPGEKDKWERRKL